MFGWVENHYGIQPIIKRQERDRQTRERNLHRHRGLSVRARPVRVVLDELASSQIPTFGEVPGLAEVSSFLIAAETSTTIVSDTGTFVAKPFPLRGAVGSRTVNGELQHIVPAFVSGFAGPVEATIYALRVGEGGTGLVGVEWLMLNDGRYWMEVV